MIQRIQYTTEQERKLLEMTNVLFPEYKETSINGAWLYLNNGEVPLDAIPIFEFCMTHLTDKVFTNDESYNNFLLSFTNSHPIDYLYTEFQKIK